MTPMSATCMMLSGLALLIAQGRSRAALWISKLTAVVIGGVCVFVLGEYALNAHLGFDTALFSRLGIAQAGLASRRMAVNTAIAFVFFAQGLIFLESDRKSRGLRSQVFATLSMIVAFVALVGHIFGVKDFYSFQLLSGMALSTAIGLTLVDFGLLFSQLDRGVPALIVDDGAAGFVARRLFPVRCSFLSF